MVNDNDVYATCGHNQCWGCIVQYDHKTALFAMNGRLATCRNPDLQVKELKPFQKQVETMLADMTVFRATMTEYGEYYDDDMSELTEEILDMMDDFNTLMDTYKNADPDTIINNNNEELREIICIFIQLFELITEYEIYQFVCHRCNAYAVRDKYVVELEVENAKLRQENIELKECMNMANEDKNTR